MKYSVFTENRGLLGLDCAGYPVYNTIIRNGKTVHQIYEHVAQCLGHIDDCVGKMPRGLQDFSDSTGINIHELKQINGDTQPRSWLERCLGVGEWVDHYPTIPLTTALVDDFNTVVLSTTRRLGATAKQLASIRIDLQTQELVYDSNRRIK